MADMTAKHHKLIQDAIEEGVKNFIGRLPVDLESRRFVLERVLRSTMADAFASRLMYTHDKFDANKFSAFVRSTR